MCGRASALHVSPVDRDDAERVGRAGVQAAIAGRHAHMVSLRPLDLRDADPCDLVPFTQVVAAAQRAVPLEWRANSDNSVTSDFVNYVRRIVGPLVDYARPLKDQWSSGAPLQRQSV